MIVRVVYRRVFQRVDLHRQGDGSQSISCMYVLKRASNLDFMSDFFYKSLKGVIIHMSEFKTKEASRIYKLYIY
jgi:hypothetical protein